MQERPQYKITPEQGWSHMQTLLGKSMPVPYRSRRFIIFWWTSAAGALAIIGSILLMKHAGNATDVHPLNTPGTEIAKSEIQVSNITGEPSSSRSIENTDSGDSQHNSVNAGFENKKSITSVTSSPNHKLVIKNKIQTAYIVSKKNTLASSEREIQNNVPATQHTIAITNIEENPNQVVISENESTTATLISGVSNGRLVRKNNWVTDFLPMTDAQDDRFSNPNIEEIMPGKIYVSHKAHPFHPGITLGAIAGSQYGLGMNGAVGTDYVLNSRITLTGSFGARSYRPGLLQNQNDKALVNDIVRTDSNYAETYLPGEKVNSSTDYNSINHFVQSIRQWEFSAGLKYSISKKLYATGGMTFGFGTSARSEYPIVTFPVNQSVADINVSTSFPYTIVRSNMMSVYGGIGYHINRHVSVSMQWTQGLNHYLLNEQVSSIILTSKRSDYIRGINMGFTLNL
ncbi:MAG: hypothetical protein ABIQ02_04270 [Saprospiraceae bacterium]